MTPTGAILDLSQIRFAPPESVLRARAATPPWNWVKGVANEFIADRKQYLNRTLNTCVIAGVLKSIEIVEVSAGRPLPGFTDSYVPGLYTGYGVVPYNGTPATDKGVNVNRLMNAWLGGQLPGMGAPYKLLAYVGVDGADLAAVNRAGHACGPLLGYGHLPDTLLRSSLAGDGFVWDAGPLGTGDMGHMIVIHNTMPNSFGMNSYGNFGYLMNAAMQHYFSPRNGGAILVPISDRIFAGSKTPNGLDRTQFYEVTNALGANIFPPAPPPVVPGALVNQKNAIYVDGKPCDLVDGLARWHKD